MAGKPHGLSTLSQSCRHLQRAAHCFLLFATEPEAQEPEEHSRGREGARLCFPVTGSCVENAKWYIGGWQCFVASKYIYIPHRLRFSKCETRNELVFKGAF